MKYLIAGLIVLDVLVAGLFGLYRAASPQPSFGTFAPTGGGTYRLQSSVGTTDTAVNLSSFKEPVSNIKYTMSYLNSTKEYGTIDPQSSRSEFVSFTGITQNSDGSAQLTGVTRGLTRTPAGSDCTASTTLAQSHAGQSIFILSDSPCFFREYLTANNISTSTAVLIFSSTTPPRLDQPGAQSTGTYIATTSEFATIKYVNGVAVAGANNATEGVKGLVQLGTALQNASSTALGSTGASLVIQSQHATDTPQSGCATGYTSTAGAGCSVIALLTGKIKQTWLNLTENWLFSDLSSASTTATGKFAIQAANISTSPFIANSLTYTWPSLRGASSTVLSENGSGGLSWQLPSAALCVSTAHQSSSAAATTTLATCTIPANTLNTSNRLSGSVQFTDDIAGGACKMYIDWGNGASTDTPILAASGSFVSGAFSISATTTTGSLAQGQWFGANSVNTIAATAGLTTRNASTSIANKTYIGFGVAQAGTGPCSLEGYSVQVLHQQ